MYCISILKDLLFVTGVAGANNQYPEKNVVALSGRQRKYIRCSYKNWCVIVRPVLHASVSLAQSGVRCCLEQSDSSTLWCQEILLQNEIYFACWHK